MGFYSKYCHKRLISPNPRTHPQDYLTFLLNTVKENQYDCIIPYHTHTTFLLMKNKDLFSQYVSIPPPNYSVFAKAYDKTKLLKIALKAGIICPQTYFGENLDMIIQTIEQYPVIIKASKRHTAGIAKCFSEKELREKYLEMTKRLGPCIVQEYIPNGGEYGVYTLFNHASEPVALTVQKRCRTMHSDGGASTLRETIRNEELVAFAFHLLKKIRWSGVAMVEFRVDARDKIPKLMEINPRLWGSLQLSISSGVDFPYLYYKMIMKEQVLKNLCFMEGMICRWLTGDMRTFLRNKKKLQFFTDFLNPHITYDDLSLQDPWPFIVSVISPVRNPEYDQYAAEDLNLRQNPIQELITGVYP